MWVSRCDPACSRLESTCLPRGWGWVWGKLIREIQTHIISSLYVSVSVWFLRWANLTKAPRQNEQYWSLQKYHQRHPAPIMFPWGWWGKGGVPFREPIDKFNFLSCCHTHLHISCYSVFFSVAYSHLKTLKVIPMSISAACGNNQTLSGTIHPAFGAILQFPSILFQHPPENSPLLCCKLIAALFAQNDLSNAVDTITTKIVWGL